MIKIRIDKYLSNLKFGSRKEIKELIKNNSVLVNNQIINKPDYKIKPDDLIKISDEVINFKESFILLLNKPKGYISSNIDELYPSVLNLIKSPYNKYDLKIIGRLDQDTEGLLLITNKGEYVHKIASPNFNVVKEYKVSLKYSETIENLNKLLKPHVLKDSKNNDYISIATSLSLINDKTCLISIKQGKYHQIKKMIEYINNEVILLERIKIGKLSLPSNLNKGDYIEVKIEDII